MEPNQRGLPPIDEMDAGMYHFIRENNDQGIALREEGELDEAIANYDRVLSIKGDVAVVYNNRGVAWLKKRDLDRAISDFDKALDIDPDFAAPYYNRGIAWRKK
jgi:tetratricopeptide (TPR) repeat protein